MEVEEEEADGDGYLLLVGPSPDDDLLFISKLPEEPLVEPEGITQHLCRCVCLRRGRVFVVEEGEHVLVAVLGERALGKYPEEFTEGGVLSHEIGVKPSRDLPCSEEERSGVYLEGLGQFAQCLDAGRRTGVVVFDLTEMGVVHPRLLGQLALGHPPNGAQQGQVGSKGGCGIGVGPLMFSPAQFHRCSLLLDRFFVGLGLPHSSVVDDTIPVGPVLLLTARTKDAAQIGSWSVYEDILGSAYLTGKRDRIGWHRLPLSSQTQWTYALY